MNKKEEVRSQNAEFGMKNINFFILQSAIRIRKLLCLMVALTLPLMRTPLEAGGLTSGFAKVVVENLQPGRTYRASKFFQRIIVINTTDNPAQMTMQLVRPSPSDVDPGYEPVPDVTWGVLEKDRFDVGPWGEAHSDLLITVPYDKKYLGKKYQIHVWTRAEGLTNVAVGLMHKLLFTVASEFNTEAGKEPAEVLRFKLDPFEYMAKNVKFNRPIDLYEQSGTAMTLQNPNNRECRYRVEVIPFDSAPILNLKGYEPSTTLHWLDVGEREFEVGAKSERRIPLKINVPRNPNFRNKNYLFLVRATALDGEIPFSVISRVYITTSETMLD